MNKLTDSAAPVLVSIITPVFNAQAHLTATIESVLSQSYAHIEYIIIDGGSTDGSVDIIAAYADRLAYWHSKADTGIYDAMNQGIAQARGELIGILNADDCYTPGAVARAVAKFSPEVGVIYGDMVAVSQRVFYRRRQVGTAAGLRFRTSFNHPTCFVAKRVYKELGVFDSEHFQIAGDYDFLLRACRAPVAFCYLPEVQVVMPEGGASSGSWRKIGENYRVRRQYFGWGVAAVVTAWELFRSATRHLLYRTLGVSRVERFKAWVWELLG